MPEGDLVWRAARQLDAALAGRVLTTVRRLEQQPARPIGAEHWVYRRPGRPCRRCGTPIRSGSQGEPTAERVTFWCPTCQAA